MDIGIIGGGLAGLACGITLTRAGKDVTILERSTVDKHKVCGEYVSLESLPILQKLGVDMQRCPIIDKARLTNGSTKFTFNLPLGGVGISRKKLDGNLANIFKRSGGALLEHQRVQQIELVEGLHLLKTPTKDYAFSSVIDASGKNENFVDKRPGPRYVALKFHTYPPPGYAPDCIHLDFFPGGYVGSSAIEDGHICVCLLIAENIFNKVGKEDIYDYIATKNPVSKVLLSQKPIEHTYAIANFCFGLRQPSALKNPQIGDAFGLIPPLSGNGMSLALRHGSTLALQLLRENNTIQHTANFGFAMLLQKITNVSVLRAAIFHASKVYPAMWKTLVQQTHGLPY